MSTQVSNKKEREYLFDNYRGILIFLIVTGHFLDLNYKNNAILTSIKWFIYSFHVPAFVFISGYFSKKDFPITVLVKSILLPYLVLEIIYYFYYTYLLNVSTGLYLLYPKFSLWYLVCLFVWRLVPDIKKYRPLILILAITGGLLIGLSGIKSNFLTLPRMLVFFPFFLLGRWFTEENLTFFRQKKIRILSVTIFSVATVGLSIFANNTTLSPKVFYGRYNYSFLKQTSLEGLLARSICYLFSLIIIYSLLGIVSRRQSYLSTIGQRTLAIYIFHGFVYNFFKYKTTILHEVSTPVETLLLLLFCVFLTLLFSLPIFTTMIKKIS